MSTIIRAGVIGDAESWREFWLLGPMTEEEAREYCEENNIEEHYSGPGRTFSRKPWIKRTKRRTLIVQSGGLDI